MKKKNINIGAAFLFVTFGLLFFILAGRFLYIQFTGEADGEVLAVKAQEKVLKERGVEASRGSILDRKGNVLAEDKSTYKLIAILSKDYKDSKGNPKYVTDPEETAKALAEYIDMDEAEILKRLSKEGPFQVEFGSAGRDLTLSTKQQIEELELTGISFVKDTKRYYPNGVFASHVIGYTEGDDEGETVGMLGLEKTLDDRLKGIDGAVNYESDMWGYLLPNSEEKVKATPENGDNVTLTLDKKIQTFVEDSLNKVDEEYNPKLLMAIVMNPKTGEIYAMGQRPSFNSNTKEGLTSTWKNIVVEENYELGSTMKVFALAAAIEEGVYQPNATYVSKDMKFGNSKGIGDHSGIKEGTTLTYLEGLQRSSNIAFVKIVLEQLGADTYMEYLKDFGFDSKTGIDLPNEVGSTIVYDKEIEQATTAFGQGSVFTPIQHMQAITAIANNGKMMKPYVISSITDSSGKVIEKNEPTVVGKPISESTAKQVREYLETVITAEKGTGVKYAIDGYSVAGKTGTAQIVSSGSYASGVSNYYFSFIGMAPAEDPELVMYVAMQQPELPAGKSATDGLSSTFKTVMKNSLNYLSIEPTNIDTMESNKVGSYEGMNITMATDELSELEFGVIVLGTGTTVTGQSSPEGTSLMAGEKILLLTEGDIQLPDMKGWSKRDVLKLASLLGIDVKVDGSGYVASQTIPAGTVLKEDDKLSVKLVSPDSIDTEADTAAETDEEATVEEQPQESE
ncbi:MAG: penicillin-binding protein [Bacillus sp. (in: firmicutes)]